MEHRGDLWSRRAHIWRVVLAGVLLTAALGALAACGQAGDQRSDCTTDEYYDEGNQECRACPAAVVPECRPGCGFRIESDSRGCPVARCGAQPADGSVAFECRCPAGQYFSEETFVCTSCDDAVDPPDVCVQ